MNLPEQLARPWLPGAVVEAGSACRRVPLFLTSRGVLLMTEEHGQALGLRGQLLWRRREFEESEPPVGEPQFVGTRRFNSSSQFCTRIICVTFTAGRSIGRIIRNRVPSRETSYWRITGVAVRIDPRRGLEGFQAVKVGPAVTGTLIILITPSAVGSVVKNSSVPSRDQAGELPAAAGDRLSATRTGIRLHEHFVSARFRGRVGQPPPIGRKLGVALVEPSREHRNRLAITGQRKQPDVASRLRVHRQLNASAEPSGVQDCA